MGATWAQEGNVKQHQRSNVFRFDKLNINFWWWKRESFKLVVAAALLFNFP